jgi:hypothetical protein
MRMAAKKRKNTPPPAKWTADALVIDLPGGWLMLGDVVSRLAF